MLRKEGVPSWKSKNLYISLISLSAIQFGIFLLATYIIVNVGFALLYFISGAEITNLSGANGNSLLDYVYFSAQTLTTVGFGHLSPLNWQASVLAALESFVGLLLFALATGLLFARFSRPKANVKFSESALISPYQDGYAFMFRLANLANAQLTELDASVVYSILNPVSQKREYQSLPLERSHISLLVSNWTVVHPIDEHSPFSKISLDDMQKNHVEIIVLIKAFEQQTNSNVFMRTSFRVNEIISNATFIPMLTEEPGKQQVMDINLLNAHQLVDNSQVKN